jgi:hypothetical protein
MGLFLARRDLPETEPDQPQHSGSIHYPKRRRPALQLVTETAQPGADGTGRAGGRPLGSAIPRPRSTDGATGRGVAQL